MSVAFMRFILLILIPMSASCTTLPDLYKAIDDVATDDAIVVKVDRDAVKKDKDVTVNVEVKTRPKI